MLYRSFNIEMLVAICLFFIIYDIWLRSDSSCEVEAAAIGLIQFVENLRR